MTLSEIYQNGAEILESTKLGFMLRGVETEFVLRNNEEIFQRYKFRQQAINSVEATTETKLLDVELKVPVIMSSITNPIPQIQENGLLKVARALKETGSLMCLGSRIPSNLKEVVEVGVPVVLTVKPYADRNRLMETISEAEEAGVTWVGIEVDAGMGTKIADRQMVKDCSPISVDEIKEIKQRISRPLVLKGILGAEDAERALEAGADVIVVSNHGAHTIDYLPHPLEVMDEIVGVVARQIPIIVDGGFRRGTDVLKALALGAQAVGLGRPILYGLAADGEEGVKTVIREIAGELSRTMTMTGVKNPASAHRGIIL
ncbi:alpha-hydroxy-acid oxidizing protein [Chloroflexota bacterium]